MLGTTIESIEATEDRAIFRDKVEEIGERVAPSAAAFTVQVGRLGCCCYVFVVFFFRPEWRRPACSNLALETSQHRSDEATC